MLDWRRLPARLAATLAAGLPFDSRVQRHLRGEADKPPFGVQVQVGILDELRWLHWAQSKAAADGQPFESLMARLFGAQSRIEDNGYSSPEEFWAAWNNAGGEENGGK